MWLDVQPSLSRRAVDCVVAAGAALTEKKLHDEYASLATVRRVARPPLSLLTLSADALRWAPRTSSKRSSSLR